MNKGTLFLLGILGVAVAIAIVYIWMAVLQWAIAQFGINLTGSQMIAVYVIGISVAILFMKPGK